MPSSLPTSVSARGACAVAALLLVCAAGLLIEAARSDSVTVDEFTHLPTGLYYLHTGRFNVGNVSPPLLRVWCALPVWGQDAGTDFSRFITAGDHWALGYEFMHANAGRYHTLFTWARAPTAALVLVLIVALFAGGWRLFGPLGGVAAAMLAAFEPNILAHGHLVTADLGHTLGFFVAVMAYARALRRRTPTAFALAGVALGLAQLTKFTALLLYPLCAALTLVAALADSGPARRRWGGWFGLVIATGVSLLVLNAGYLFSGSGGSLSAYALRSVRMQSLAGTALSHLPLPFPADFVRGLDQQIAEGEGQGQWPVFLHGELSWEGWWYYYLAAFVLKTPLPVLILFAAGTIMWVARGRLRRHPLRSAVLLLPPVVYVATVSLLTDINVGLRYILPAYPFVFLVGASLCVTWPWRRRWLAIALAVLLGAHVTSAALTRPHFLSYFNVVAGGSANGYRWLIDSNVDWGQDLIRLREYLEREGIPRVFLTYFGRVAPEIYGIAYRRFPPAFEPGVYVVSASYLMGRPYYLHDHGSLYWVPAHAYSGLQRLQPSARVGGSLFVYDLRDGEPESLAGH